MRFLHRNLPNIYRWITMQKTHLIRPTFLLMSDEKKALEINL